jgi:membrane-associated two-gene conflict system component 1 (EACC1)
MTQVHVHVAGYPDSDDDERADLTERLRADLLAHDLDVSHPAAEAPPGSKGAGLELAQLLVTFAGMVPAMAAALQGWLGRHPRAAVTLEIDGDKLTLDQASAADQQRLVETFLARHGAG